MSLQREVLTGIFFDRGAAEDAVARLRQLGYRDDEISVIMSDDTRSREFADATGSMALEGATSGAIIGGGLGAILAALTATGSVVAIAGTGGAATPLVAGPLAAALAGLGAGGAAGGILGALIGAGIRDDRAAEYAEGLQRGGIVLAVQSRGTDLDDESRSIFEPQAAGERVNIRDTWLDDTDATSEQNAFDDEIVSDTASAPTRSTPTRSH